jgi:hypothetical protein
MTSFFASWRASRYSRLATFTIFISAALVLSSSEIANVRHHLPSSTQLAAFFFRFRFVSFSRFRRALSYGPFGAPFSRFLVEFLLLKFSG